MNISECFALYTVAKVETLSPRTAQTYNLAYRYFISSVQDRPIGELATPQGRNLLLKWRSDVINTIAYASHPTLDSSERTISISSACQRLTSVRTFILWCVDEPHIPLNENPLKGISFPAKPANQLPKAIELDTVEKLVKGAKSSHSPFFASRNLAMIYFFASTACRSGGLVSLRVENVDLRKGQAFVTEKGEKTRMVHLSENAVQAMLEWKDQHPCWRKGQYVFVSVQSGKAQQLTTNAVYNVLRRIAEREGIDEGVFFNPHAFRHACAIEAIKNGVDISIVSRLLGHSDISVTMKHYAVFTQEQLKDYAKKMSLI